MKELIVLAKFLGQGLELHLEDDGSGYVEKYNGDELFSWGADEPYQSLIENAVVEAVKNKYPNKVKLTQAGKECMPSITFMDTFKVTGVHECKYLVLDDTYRVLFDGVEEAEKPVTYPLGTPVIIKQPSSQHNGEKGFITGEIDEDGDYRVKVACGNENYYRPYNFIVDEERLKGLALLFRDMMVDKRIISKDGYIYEKLNQLTD